MDKLIAPQTPIVTLNLDDEPEVLGVHLVSDGECKVDRAEREYFFR